MHRLGALLVLPLLLSACARPPGVLRGSFAPLTPRDVQAEPVVGERVRWGGEIVSTRPGKDKTCFEVVSKPLDRQARPIVGDETLGRFVACAPGFYDPAIYAARRDVMVTGALGEPMSRKVGDYEYRFPVVRAEAVYLWPKREERVFYYDPWRDPFWGPYPYWGWGVGGFVEVPVPVRRPPRPKPGR